MVTRTLVPPNHDIILSTDEDGNLHAEIAGVQGQGCAGLLDILGDLGIIVSQEHTGDWNKPDPQGRSTISSVTTHAH
jgi:hypothetical protein